MRLWSCSQVSLRKSVVVLIVVVLQACGGEEKVQWCSDSLDSQAPIISTGLGTDPHNTRNNPSSIYAHNVANLSLDYALSQPAQEERRGAVALTEQAVFFHEEHSVRAVNRQTGCQYWATYIEPRVRSAATTLFDDPKRHKRLLAVGTLGAEVFTLDASTGKILWRKDLGVFDENAITGGLQYHDGTLLVPLSSLEVSLAAVQTSCCKTHGLLVAVDSSNGNVLWQFHTTANAKRIKNSKYWGPSGVSVWSSPLIDAARNQVLVGTAQNFAPPATELSDSVVALDLTTGKLNWWYQVTPMDIYNMSCDVLLPLFNNCPDLSKELDWDVITPVLTQTSTGEDIIIGADKGGSVFALNPNDGSVRWRSHIGVGTSLGGVHWGMAVDEDSVYVGINDLQGQKVYSLAVLLRVANILPLQPNYVLADGGKPGVYALDKDNGELRWSFTQKRWLNGKSYPVAFSAALSVTNDVVFAGALNGELFAIQSTNGELLWKYNTAVQITDVYGREGQGGTIDASGPIPAGDQVFLNSGYSTFGGSNEFHGGPGNTLFVFGLKN